ncbi:MAG: hypothetical protein KBD31_00285 [Proteobacteria bacterium]|nr:hypothetical protein [Pseudomonadota bacterium]
MKYIIALSAMLQLLFSAELQVCPLSKEQALMLENKFMNTPYNEVTVSESRLIVQYLVDSKTETLESLMKKLNENIRCGYCVRALNNFYLGIQGWGEFTEHLKNYYTITNCSLVSPPVIIETHWYDPILNLFQRSDSESSSDSRESNKSLGYLKKDWDNNDEKKPLIEKSKEGKKKD